MHMRRANSAIAAILLMLSGQQPATAMDPGTLMLAEPLLRTIDAGFEAIDSGAQALTSLIGITGALRGSQGLATQRDLTAIRQDLTQVNSKLDDLAVALNASTDRILAAIDDNEQRLLFSDAYALQRTLELRVADLASVNEQERDYAQIQRLRFELETLTFRAEGLLKTSRGAGVHYIAAIHALSVSAGQIQAVLGPSISESEQRSLRTVNDTLVRASRSASSKSSALQETVKRGQKSLTAHHHPLLEDGLLATGMRSACFAIQDRFKTGESTEDYEDCGSVGFLPIKRCKDRTRQVADYLTHYIETRFAYSISQEDRAGIAFLGALRPAPDNSARTSTTTLPSPDCNLVTGTPEEAWKAITQDYNQQVVDALPDLQRVVIAAKAIELAQTTQAYLEDLRTVMQPVQDISMN